MCLVRLVMLRIELKQLRVFVELDWCYLLPRSVKSVCLMFYPSIAHALAVYSWSLVSCVWFYNQRKAPRHQLHRHLLELIFDTQRWESEIKSILVSVYYPTRAPTSSLVLSPSRPSQSHFISLCSSIPFSSPSPMHPHQLSLYYPPFLFLSFSFSFRIFYVFFTIFLSLPIETQALVVNDVPASFPLFGSPIWLADHFLYFRSAFPFQRLLYKKLV